MIYNDIRVLLRKSEPSIKHVELDNIDDGLEILVVTTFEDKREFGKTLSQIADVYEKKGIKVKFRQYTPENYKEYTSQRESKLLK